MNGLDEEQMTPQTFLYGCVLKSGKEVVFNPEDDDFEHQLDLRMVCVDASTKDELHMVEVEGHDTEGQKVKAVLASIKPSTMPSACLGGFTITPPAVFRLKAGAGPVHISGQHLVMMGGDQSFDEEEEEEEEEEAAVKTPKKRPASTPSLQLQKKLKKDEEDEEDDDDEDDEEEDDDEEDEESPIKAKSTPSKPKAAALNGKNAKASTPAPKEVKTPNKANQAPKSQTPKSQTPKSQTPKSQTPKSQTPKSQTPKSQTPKAPLTIAEIKDKMIESQKKGIALPKQYNKFENFVKNCFKVSEQKAIIDLWKWRQSINESQ